VIKYFSSCIAFILIHVTVAGQIESGLGDWTAYLPYQSAEWVTQSDNKIIISTGLSIMTIDKNEGSRQFISKVDGLSDVGIFRIKHDRYNDQLIIAYNNSNIDIVKGSQVINIPNIKSNQNLSGDRLIYDIHIANADVAYLATGFGITELKLKTLDFGFTTKAIKVNNISSLNGVIYAATDAGLYNYKPQNGFAGDFNNWELIGESNGLPNVYEANYLANYNSQIYVAIDNSVYKSDGLNKFEKIFNSNDEFNIRYLTAEGSHLIVGLKEVNTKSYIALIDETDQVSVLNDGCINRTRYAIEDEQQRIWYADDWDLIRYHESLSGGCKKFTEDSPYSSQLSDIELKDNTVYVASGGVSDNFTYNFTRRGVYILENNDWTNINQDETRFFAENDILNFFRVLPHPDLDLLYMGTYWAGLVQYDLQTDEIKVFNKENSTLRGVPGDDLRERVAGLKFDADGNLWVANYGATEALSVLTPDGNWHSFNTGAVRNISNPTIDEFNNKWFPVFGTSGGVLVYNHGERIEDPTDDQYKLINQSNSEITTSAVNDIEVDLDGSVWVATAEGPVIFDCGSDPFSSDCTGRRIKVLQDSIAAFLLTDVDIKTIEIDGANRKWFGTRNGIFVQSAAGDEQVLRFTTDNSPLYDDNIIDLAYDGESGMMWIGTDKGLLSYRTLTSSGGRRHSSNVYAYPNPVPPNHLGPIAIKGLANESSVKITDLNGKLLFESKSLGGQAIWDGNDFGGNRVKSGVYLVFSATSNIFADLDSYVTKILVIN